MGAKFSKFRNRVTKSITARFRRHTPSARQPNNTGASLSTPSTRQRTNTTRTSLNEQARIRRRKEAAKYNGTRMINPLRPETLTRNMRKASLGKVPLIPSPLVPNNSLSEKEKEKRRKMKEFMDLLTKEEEYRRLLREKEEKNFAAELDEIAAGLF